ncbi:MAG: PP2C family protein-serine/threonine phosphatase [Acidimicrobiales bacterium]
MFGPFVASALLSPLDTAVAGVVAVVSAFVLGWPDGTAGTSAHLVRVLAVAVSSLMAYKLACERTRREEKLVAVRRVAEAAQQAILRPLPKRVGRLGLVGRYVSATAEASVDGDFYEAVVTPWGARLVVGDVRGKGLEAVRLASALLGEFRSRAATEADFADVVSRLDAAASVAGGPEDFATAILAQTTDEGLTVVRCGHPQPLRADSSGHVIELDIPGTLPLGLGACSAVAAPVALKGDQRLLLDSDGAIETRDAGGRYFNLAASLQRARPLDADAAVQQILDDLGRHAGGVIGDDVVLVLAEPWRPGASDTRPQQLKEDSWP